MVGHLGQAQDQPQTALPASPPPSGIDEHVTQWSELGFRHYIFLGTWGPNEVTYQASVWLRLFPTNISNERAVRLVIQLNTAPNMQTEGSHAITPQELLNQDGKLPALTFTAATPPGSPVEEVVVQQQYWPRHLTETWNASPIQGRAVLRLDVHYQLRMEGCERVFHIPAYRSSRAHSMFQDGDVWMGRSAPVAKLSGFHATAPFQFLVLEHLRHHLRLGFKGTIMVVLPEIAALLLADAGILEAVKQRQLVLVLWEYGVVARASNFMQLPTHNLLMAAMAGSNTTLGLWDLDEFLVLPGHRSISDEVNAGCLTQLHDPSSMAIEVPFSLTLPGADWSDGPDIPNWIMHGGFEAAIKTMNYTAQPYKHCGYCKILVNPNTIYNMHVHWLVKPPDEGHQVVTADRGCTYIHHFYHLWHTRIFRAQAKLSEKEPLAVQDLPFSE